MRFIIILNLLFLGCQTTPHQNLNKNLLEIVNAKDKRTNSSFSLFYHYLIGSNWNEYEIKKAYLEWKDANLDIKDLQQSHRGQLAKLMAVLELDLKEVIKTKNGNNILIRDYLSYELDRFNFDSPINRRENAYGVEFGFLLYPACHYYNELGNYQEKVINILQSAIKLESLIDLENSIHEIEALQKCINSVKLEEGLKTNIEEFIDNYIKNEFLKASTRNWQVFSANKSQWPKCKNADEVCQTIVNINKQAHFIELLYLRNKRLQSRSLKQVIKRFYKLERSLSDLPFKQWSEDNIYNYYLLSGMNGHYRHVKSLLNILIEK